MRGTAMTPRAPAWRDKLRPGIDGGIVAVGRGWALCGLMLAGFGLLLVPLLVLFLGVLGVYGVLSGGPHELRNVYLSLSVWSAGLAAGRYGIPAALMAVRRLAILTRRLSGEWCGVPIADPYLPPPAAGNGKLSRRQRLMWLLGDPATWRDMLWMAVNAGAGWIPALVPAGLIALGMIDFIAPAFGAHFPPPGLSGNNPPVLIGLGVALEALGVGAAPWLLRGYGLLARSVLGPRGDAELALRVRHLAETRSETIDAGAAEIRRIERDLHDGAQARLVAMGMTLSAAEELLDSSPAAARALLLEARESSAKALAELRALVRGIHPPVLADRGLADAIRALALDSGLNVDVAAGLGGRPPAPVESAGYFAVSELLANVSKHAGAGRAWVDVRHDAGMLRIGVTDDGCGGADPARGTGLRGIERRLAAFDGVLAVSSPLGGPTVVNMEIPCVLSSPKTSSC
jgi:signal transduction histidine kinase